jgi:hypothetical protein
MFAQSQSRWSSPNVRMGWVPKEFKARESCGRRAESGGWSKKTEGKRSDAGMPCHKHLRKTRHSRSNCLDTQNVQNACLVWDCFLKHVPHSCMSTCALRSARATNHTYRDCTWLYCGVFVAKCLYIKQVFFAAFIWMTAMPSCVVEQGENEAQNMHAFFWFLGYVLPKLLNFELSTGT